ncbi:hypothetical protein KEM48_014212 [Puccinia striiformis f. sp. tritici PST-130]|nr:hypothetical protein KEM48_014212 [Puccinia striiformis f. sp. tritici PST-130]
MARNEEKAQSMLYRFREAQAAELGMSTKSDRRPRLASSCQDLRQCERWRGEILREVSRKVSKIQDAGLTDYEVRDLNDEINKLLREKGHWENQIINLGGANYRRVGSSTFDGAGRSAPGQRGYKYFGRAKELPGVKELFEGASKQQEELDGLKKNDDIYYMFKNQGPSYFGDLDEYGAEGEQLLKYESAHERQATNEVDLTSRVTAEPEGQLSAIRDKRKADSDPPGTPSKKKSSNLDESGVPPDQQDTQAMPNSADPSDQSEKTTVPPKPPLSIFDPADLQPPPVPTIEQWGQLIMQLQKAALLKEYIG